MKYRHVLATRIGGPEVLQVVEDDLPEPASGEVRVKVLASGVAFGDVLSRTIFRLIVSRSPGYDIVGVVDKLGHGVQALAVGQIVVALPARGGYSTYINLPATELIPVPTGLDPAETVSLALNYLTAYQLLHHIVHIHTGQRILIHGAAGGVGTALLQLGRLAGVEMYGTASQGKHEIVRRLGGIPIDYRNEEIVPRLRQLIGDQDSGVDAVYDPIGGIGHLWQSYRALRRGGTLVFYGFSGAIHRGKTRIFSLLASITLLAMLWLLPGKHIAWYGVTQVKSRHPDWYREDMATLLDLLAQKSLQPIIAQRLPFTQAAQAHELLENASIIGKVVLVNDEKS